MRKDTKASIDEKIAQITDDNHYLWYQLFHNAGKTNRNEVAKYYIDSIAGKFNQADKLLTVFEEVHNGENLNLLESDYRKASDFKISLRGKVCDSEVILKETYIQRNLFKNSHLYEDKLGHIFGYEVTFVRKNRLAPVDLISYTINDGKLCLNLIELKACEAETIKSPANDMLLRALFEIATYKAYFKKVLHKNDELALAIKNNINNDTITLQDIKNADVKLIILAPDYIIDEQNNNKECIEPFIKPDIELLTIKPARKFDNTTLVGSQEKLFIIE